MNCICGLKRDYDECCGTIIDGERTALSPEELMRSRYSAYVKGDGKYLVYSCAKESRYEDDIELIEEFSNSVEWLKLEVLDSYDDTVEFKAYYLENKVSTNTTTQNIKLLHERSKFILEDGVWKYLNGELFNSRIERNESCPCGSGKKFKKCCA